MQSAGEHSLKRILPSGRVALHFVGFHQTSPPDECEVTTGIPGPLVLAQQPELTQSLITVNYLPGRKLAFDLPSYISVAAPIP